MHVERKWHILLTIFFLLISSGQCMDSKQVKQNERRTLLDLILQVIKDSQQRDKPVSRRCGSGLHTSAQDFKSSSREKPLYVPRLDNTRLIDIVPRDAHMKDKFIEHFGGDFSVAKITIKPSEVGILAGKGHVKFSSECKTHFHRLYHTTRDCSRPAYYKRCARLLTRLAMSPLCMQS
ncbi:protein ALKAL-like isoform X2 [Gambusia affinis]|uniref:protein ALKAL-like isoform X2 n=1 Tax=Gambusia affinis TaxID=33528 RepID=UPI001CDB642C|nr:protein ALKAL-like isoform X2 [Gambusia affinis]XP_043985372.1 protein ALKAL-like isoform X2 [Gambusia affinis]